jgi:hypothetical protein
MSPINIITEAVNFFKFVKPLAQKKNIFCYFSYRNSKDKTKITYKLVDFKDDKLGNLLSAEYDLFFFTSKEFEPDKEFSFYKDDYFEYSAECKGGRKKGDDIEAISLRLISKAPEPTIKSFFNSINSQLKKDSNFGLGIGKTNNAKKIFYSKEIINSYTFWYDLEKKVGPIPIEI